MRDPCNPVWPDGVPRRSEWPPPRALDRLRSAVARGADLALIATAAVLPWSTSATAVLLVCWAMFATPTVGMRALADELCRPAAWLPVALWSVAAVGMLWTETSWTDALNGLRPYHKLLAVPLLLAHLGASRQVRPVVLSFVASCGLLLAISWAQVFWPGLVFDASRTPGVPVKDRIVQGVEFTICGTALLAFAVAALRRNSAALAATAGLIAALFLVNVFVVAATRTGAVLVLVLLGLLGWRSWRWRGLGMLAGAGVLLLASALAISPGFRDRIVSTAVEIEQYEADNAQTSTGLRLDYWRQALRFVARAPLVGHGTGSTQRLSQDLAEEEQSSAGVIIPGNPHNQILAVAVQLGLVGAIFLVAMWLAHWRLFVASGMWSLIGALLVAENVVASLFNSHIFDVAPGWIYVIGVPALAVLASNEAIFERQGAGERPR